MKHEELLKWAKKLDKDVVFSYSKNKDISGSERKIVYQIAGKLSYADTLSFKQLNILYDIVSRIKEMEFHNAEIEYESSHNIDESITDINHLCLRLAWHDNKWNGCVCNSPADNSYCVGEHSLLSERIRKRRNIEIETRKGIPGNPPDKKILGEYQPPCFWSINAFGKQTLNFEHDNPVAADFPHISQELPPYSVISWPFKLSFVKNSQEKDKYGNYYPKDIFENRIKRFQDSVRPGESLVFLYCKFSNPVSGEDMDYLVAGCAILKEQGKQEWFDITDEQLQAKAKDLKQPNFPSMNWALRYTTDFEHTGVRIPYHEYLQMADKPGGISEDLIKEIAVTIREPELRDGFSYVARHVDDDQAIYLLMKIRKSILNVKEHGFIHDYNFEDALSKIEFCLESTWLKRGYLPGLVNLILAIPGLAADYTKQLQQFVKGIDLSEHLIINTIKRAIEDREVGDIPGIDGLLNEIADFLDEEDLDTTDLLRLASLNLTRHQFSRIVKSHGLTSTLVEICRNPYLLAEEYEPDNETEHPLTGEKIDGVIDFFKIDISLFPHVLYLKKDKEFHDWKISDKRRVRAVIIDILKNRENSGDCFLDTGAIKKELENYPLFYKNDKDYRFKENLADPLPETALHFRDKLVFKKEGEITVYYLKEIYDAEIFVGDSIAWLLDKDPYDTNTEQLEADLNDSVNILSTRIGNAFDSELFITERRQLYKSVMNNSFSVISGFPGSGKSYELLKLINHFDEIGETHLVLALTGKAVLRLSNNDEGFTAIAAKTIDKYLNECRRNADQGGSILFNNLIIDESSMIDLPKLREVLEFSGIRKSYFKRLILVGDENQLPPIGFGKPYSDIINYLNNNPDKYNKNIVRLESNCRAELDDTFLDFTSIFSGENKSYEELLASTDHQGEICNGGVKLMFWKNKNDLYQSMDNELNKLLTDSDGKKIDISEYLGINKKSATAPTGLEKYQVISPNRTGFYGASGINLHFQEDLRKQYEYGKSSGETALKLLDKVMHTENEYKKNELFISNGSMGGVTDNKKVFFLEREKVVNLWELRNKDALELAYAITVHKSQGSGFDQVHVVLPARKRFVSRELLYTALTRTKKKVTVFIQKPDDDYSIAEYFRKVRYNSDILQRRTSLLSEGVVEYAYNPEEDVYVKSRVEYIIYRKLMEQRQSSGAFSFRYEETYKLDDKAFNLHPDFVLHFDDGRIIYWEHLGMVTSRSYLRRWDQRRRIYEEKGDLDNVITTDELRGINDEKIDAIIEALIKDEVVTEDTSNRYSNMHFSLR